MRKESTYKSILPVAILLFLLGGAGYMLFLFLSPKKTLPVYNPVNVHPDLVDESVADIAKDHVISDFSVLNQEGKTITQKDYNNRIYVANFFFTRCKTICLPMMDNMKILQETFIDDDQVKLLSYSVTPVIDSVSVLKSYAEKRGIIESKWNITTGSKKHIYNLARKSYFAVLDEGDGDLQDFIHTERFILVDKNKQIRGFYDGTNTAEIKQLIADIALLKAL